MELILIYLRPRMLQMLLLGFFSGLPLSLTGSTLQAWYTVSGVSIVAIGFLTLVAQPYAYKFLWAPIMDRYIPPFLGHRRGWIVITQIALLIALIAMANFDPKVNPKGLALLALIVAFCSASQDICLDAYRTEVLSSSERGAGSAMWITGYRIAMLVSGGLALILASYYGWRVAYIAMGVLMLLGIMVTIRSDSPTQRDVNPGSLTAAIIEPFQEFFSRPYALIILLFIILYKLGDAFLIYLSTAFYLKGIGFSLVEVGAMSKTVSLAGSLAGLFIGGSIMMRLGLYRSLMMFGMLRAGSNIFFIWQALAGKVLWLLGAGIFVENFTDGMVTAAFLAFLMSLCHVKYTATQLALLTALMSVGWIFVNPLSGLLIAHIGWVKFLVCNLLAAIPALILLRWLRDRIDFTAERPA